MQVVNYPYDAYATQRQRQQGGAHSAPDDATFKYLAHLYADKHAYMATSGVSVQTEGDQTRACNCGWGRGRGLLRTSRRLVPPRRSGAAAAPPAPLGELGA